MPEGPSLLYLKQQLLPYKGKVVKQAGGYGPMPTAWITGKKLQDIKTWGKHLLFVFANGVVKVHLGLFGDVLINERKKVNRSFYLEFANGEINGYVVKAHKLDKPLKDVYDWRTDILDEAFNKAHVKKLIAAQAGKTIADVLMDQQVFSGSGNIIRIEALYSAGIHPLSIAGKIPAAKITKLINETVKFAKAWYKGMTKGSYDNDGLFKIYQQKYTADGNEVTMKILPAAKRKIYFDERRQVLYR